MTQTIVSGWILNLTSFNHRVPSPHQKKTGYALRDINRVLTQNFLNSMINVAISMK